MSADIFKKNWIFVVLFCIIVAINVLSHLGAKEKSEEALEAPEEVAAQIAPDQSLFVEFGEAQARSKKIQEALLLKPFLYLLYLGLNLLIIFMFFSGIFIDGYFIFSKLKKKEIFPKTDDPGPPAWTLADIFKIIIAAIAFSYVFFMAFAIFIKIAESLLGTGFSFYKNTNFRMIFDTIVLDLFVFATVFWVLGAVYKKNFSNIGISLKNLGKNILCGITGYIGVLPLIFLVGILVYAILNVVKIAPPPQPIVGLFLAEKNAALIIIHTTSRRVLVRMERYMPAR